MWISWTQWNHTGGSSAVLFILMFWTVLWDIVQNFQCPPCHKLHCSPRRASKLNCKGGITTGVCGCCPVCAKQEGEECGGHYAYRGKCDRNLDCVLTLSPSTVITNTHTLQTEQVGICKKTVPILELKSCTWFSFEKKKTKLDAFTVTVSTHCYLAPH
ncbi:Cysteine-rich motor neuron 1 protein [Bulinus truncatus]|nr:Cysteine-rich motor neuron 1 protein [Bulinus truncatus]